MREIQEMNYGYAIELPIPFAEAVAKVKEVFQPLGFGVLSEIDVQEKMKEKLGKEMGAYVILGMCNPKLAAAAIDIEPNIGLLLPCNVIVRETEGGAVVAAQKPSMMSQVVEAPGIEAIAKEAEEKIVAALHAIEKGVL